MYQTKLDKKDRKILYQLDTNARQPNSAIAKKVGLSKDVVNYRIKQLEKEGFIRGYYTIIDFSKLSYFSFRVYLKLFDTTPEIDEEIIDFLIRHPKVFYVAETEGLMDIDFGAWVKSIYEFGDFYSEFKQRFNQYVLNQQISVFTGVHHFHRAYILNRKFDDNRPKYFGGSEVVKHDKTDIGILRLLAQNSRIPVVEISRKLKIPAKTAAFRIKQLEKKGIIQDYRFIFDFRLYGYEYYKVDLTLKDISRIKELTRFAQAHPNILYVDETIAGSDFEFDAEVANKAAFLELIAAIRKRFPEIRSYTFFTLRKFDKLLYFPEL